MHSSTAGHTQIASILTTYNDTSRNMGLLSCFSLAQSCSALWDPRDYSMQAFPVLNYLSEFTQTHIHWVGDAIQPSHPRSSPSPPAPNPSQHQGLFRWVSSLYQVAKVLEFQLQHQSFRWTPRTDLFRMDWLDLLAAQRTLESSPAPQFKSISSLTLSLLYGPAVTSMHYYWGWVYLFKLVFLFSSHQYPEIDSLNLMVVLLAFFFFFWGTSSLFSLVAALIFIPIYNSWGFLFFISSPTFAISSCW